MRQTLASLLIAAAAISSAQTAQPPLQYGREPNGRAVTSLADPGTRAVVLFFVASDCPISNRTFPEMQRVREAFSENHVRVWFVYANAGEDPAVVAAHQRSFDPGGDAILDTAGTLARMTGAKVTPEAAVLVPSSASPWRPVYTGRIDDRYVKLGLERPQATQHFVERVLHEVLAGQPVDKPDGHLIGRGIVSPHPAPQGSGR
jgi:hypothetical protein